MTEHLSDQDLERIAKFAATPAYEREPEQLLPEDERPPDERSGGDGPTSDQTDDRRVERPSER